MRTEAVYKTRPIRRKRRSRDAIQEVRDSIFDMLQSEHPMTVRQVFYRLTGREACCDGVNGVD